MEIITINQDEKDFRTSYFAMLNHFPIPIEVFSPEGISIFVNSEFIDFFRILYPSEIIGKFNILEEPFLNEKTGFSDYLKRVFSGEILSFTDFRVPFEEIQNRFSVKSNKPLDNEIYQDIISFPLFNEDGSVNYIITVFITKRIYQSRFDTIKARDYIDNHWMEDFNLDEIAKHTGLCKHYLSKLFKNFIGMTPYGYYQEVKVKKIKEALQNNKLSISEAFMSCGADYSGGIADTFKRKTGMTPSMYRKSLYNKKSDNIEEDDQYQAKNTYNTADDIETQKRLFKIAELFPIPIQIFRVNGDIVYINEAVLRMWNILDDTQILEKYNLLRDPFVHGYPQLSDGVKKAFKGEIVLIQDIRIPLESFWEWYKTRTEAYDIEAVYTDILNFPIKDNDGNMIYMVSIFFTSRIYKGKSEVAKAREYIENNWREDFDMEKISEIACLSSSHLVRLFKKHTGVTPYRYYQDLKVIRLKEVLRDKNLSIAEAFLSCGFEYSGNYARFFKMHVGMTPSQYRKSIKI
ncbi:MAG: AraC family transcriptional regulator [Anaerolineaceae bacterium]|nr:MAG: AraC family transcriptional regulator [Anaerolineaceae bacterium]